MADAPAFPSKNDLGLLPKEAAAYKQTPVFDVESVPQGLLRDHSTKKGVWGVLHLLKGNLTYRVPERKQSEHLSAGDKMLIESAVVHRVEISADAQFFVEFWRLDSC